MFRGCNKCDKGYIYHTINDDIFVSKCECLIKFQKEKILYYNILDSNVSSEYYKFNISSYKGEKSKDNLNIINYFLDNFEKEYYNYNMFFTGIQGTQKTTISKYMIIELLKKEKSCYYILADSLMKLLLQSERNDEIKEKIDLILNKDFLVIDEMSDDKCTIYQSEYQIPFFTSFLKTRLEQIKKSTIFISNYTIEKLYDSKFGKTIADLVNRECKEKLIFEDNYFALNLDDVKTIADKIKERLNK